MLGTPVWQVAEMKVLGSDVAVVIAVFNCTVRDEQDPKIFGFSSGSAEFTPDPSDPNFIPYDQLTEQDVLNWIWVDGFKQTFEQLVIDQAEARRVKPEVRPLPW